VTLGNIVGGGKLYEFCRNPLQRMLNIWLFGLFSCLCYDALRNHLWELV
jgi:hypothetical protein